VTTQETTGDHLSAASGLRAWRGPTPPSAAALPLVVTCVTVSGAASAGVALHKATATRDPDARSPQGCLAFSELWELVHASGNGTL
jgi:hypothetical protein